MVVIMLQAIFFSITPVGCFIRHYHNVILSLKTIPSPKGQWVQVMFSPYEGGTSWAGWMEARNLVASRDSVKVPASAALFTVPKDEKVFPRTSGVKGVPGYHRTFQMR